MRVGDSIYNFNGTSIGTNNQNILILSIFVLVSVLIFVFFYTLDRHTSFFKSRQLPDTPGQHVLSLKSPVMPQIVMAPPSQIPFKRTSGPVSVPITIKKNFTDTLLSYGVAQSQIDQILQATKSHIDLGELRDGHVFNIELKKNTQANIQNLDDVMHIVESISMTTTPSVQLDITNTQNGYKAKIAYSKVYENSQLVRGKITSSLSANARRLGVSNKMINQFIKLFSLNIDFRQLRKNDAFEFGFDKFATKDGKVISVTPLTYASLTVNGKKNEIFYVHKKNGKGVWINEKGKNNKPLLMRTPIDGARLSSRFGLRRHPVLGYTKKHKGIDFAAPRGTPIYAAGDGVIVKKYRSSSFGNYIKIRHTGTFDTAYAHMSKFARLRVGQTVKQGQVIGYVGTTGRSTGPHLHYEVHKNGVAINPLSSKVPNVSLVTSYIKGKLKKAKQKLKLLRSGKQNQIVHKNITAVEHRI